MTITRIYGDNLATLRTLAANGQRVQAVVTSPPYLEQRTYGDHGAELGHEATVAAYVANLIEVFSACRAVMDMHAPLWCNIGDKANGSGGAGGDWGKPGGPGKFYDPAYMAPSFLDVPGALTRMMLLTEWRLRANITWDKDREAPESLAHVGRPRPSSEPILLFSPGPARSRFYPSMMAETGTVWHFPPGGDGDPHLAPFPDELARRCILASTLPGDTVLDPFGGSETVARVADSLGRHAIHLDLYPVAST